MANRLLLTYSILMIYVLFKNTAWLFDGHLKDLNFNKDILSVGVNGMDSSVLLHGRPYDGCAILVRKSLIVAVTFLSTNAVLCAYPIVLVTLHS